MQGKPGSEGWDAKGFKGERSDRRQWRKQGGERMSRNGPFAGQARGGD